MLYYRYYVIVILKGSLESTARISTCKYRFRLVSVSFHRLAPARV